MTQGLAKLTITPFAKRRGDRYERLLPIQALFNPESYTISKSVTWSPPQSAAGGGSQTQRKVNAPILSFGGGDSRQLSLELFFDVTNPLQGILDVREETNEIVRLTRIERDEEQPRVCEIAWGQAPVGSDLPFIGVITSLTQRFTQFRPEGNPVRATLSLTLKEFLDPKLDKLRTDPELTTYQVKGGETLSGIAAKVYRDPSRWRAIAQANSIDDPRHLDPLIGRRLTIPKLP
jgi:nucleoid-associated protein YgaU